MPQYQVPQFITVEDKIIGPFTIKQFLYVGSGGLLIIGAYALFQPFLFWPLAVLIGGAAASLAFLKINEQPLPLILKNAAFFFLRPQLYTWKKEQPKPTKTAATPAAPQVLIKSIPKLSDSRLTDLAWSLDIKERARN